jgi:hypothetical protein
MKLIPAYQAEQETRKVFEEQCAKVYFYRMNIIEKDIEYWKNKGYFHFAKTFSREGNDAVNDAVNHKVEKMIKELLVGYGYKVEIIYPDNSSQPTIEISWKKSFLFLFWEKIKQIISTICPK